jgi:hypothetical protein
MFQHCTTTYCGQSSEGYIPLRHSSLISKKFLSEIILLCLRGAYSIKDLIITRHVKETAYLSHMSLSR